MPSSDTLAITYQKFTGNGFRTIPNFQFTDYTETGSGTSLAESLSWDTPIATLENDSWCSIVPDPITDITPGFT